MKRVVQSVCVIGRGKVGSALASALKASELTTFHLRGRGAMQNLPTADVYILAVADAAISEVCSALSKQLSDAPTVLHCAGARGPDELVTARAAGASIGVFHPLVSFAQKRRNTLSASFTGFGDVRAMRDAKQVATSLGAHFVHAKALGPAYHAAAALVANGGVALSWVGLEILLGLRFSRPDAQRALAGLLRSVADNIENVGLPKALTGPVMRGDASTVAAHQDALRKLDPALAQAYASVQPLVLMCAKHAGLPAADARRVQRTLRAKRAQRRK